MPLARSLSYALAALAIAVPLADAVSAEGVPQICASRIYDYVHRPVASFTIDFRQGFEISNDVYARYRGDLVAAAAQLGYDPADTTFTLHEDLSTFPFLNHGVVLSLVLVLCETGHEGQNLCRRGEYYAYDAILNQDRLSLILEDILDASMPAPVDSCDFGQGDWSDLN